MGTITMAISYIEWSEAYISPHRVSYSYSWYITAERFNTSQLPLQPLPLISRLKCCVLSNFPKLFILHQNVPCIQSSSPICLKQSRYPCCQTYSGIHNVPSLFQYSYLLYTQVSKYFSTCILMYFDFFLTCWSCPDF